MMATPDPYKEHAQAKRNIAQARQEILSALQKAWPCFYQEPPTDEVGSDKCHELTLLQIGIGVRALVLTCNLRGGSTGNMNIYRLMQAYLWDRDARQKINEIVRESLDPERKAGGLR